MKYHVQMGFINPTLKEKVHCYECHWTEWKHQISTLCMGCVVVYILKCIMVLLLYVVRWRYWAGTVIDSLFLYGCFSIL